MNRVTETSAELLTYNELIWLANAYRVGEYHLAIEEKTMRTCSRATIPADRAEELHRRGLCFVVESGMAWRRRIVRTERGQEWLLGACQAIVATLSPEEKDALDLLWQRGEGGEIERSELRVARLCTRHPRLAEYAGGGARLTDLGRAVMSALAGR